MKHSAPSSMVALTTARTPKERVSEINDGFCRLLNPGGFFLVNSKIRDHSLSSLDGRFFENYRSADLSR